MSTYAGPVRSGTSNRVQLDWLAYFKRFVEVHGVPEEIDPVETEEGVVLYSRLLFPDGWRYSNFDYQGPEIPPPEEPKLSHLLMRYWRQRRSRLMQQHRELVGHIASMANWANLRDLPLQQRVMYVVDDEDGKKTVMTDVGDMDLAGLRSHAADLEHQINECDEHIENL